MDWDLKTWDMSELEPSMRPSFAPGGGLEGQTSGSDCSVDLKLGGSGNFGSSSAAYRCREGMRFSMTTVSPSSSSKRARAPNNGAHVASCLVDGCNSDLSGCREYHRRHKVCEVHSKTPMVMVNGLEQRFCQQCSRFHMLAEFDEGKRSCRKRLDGHNRRRRKPQPHAMHSANLFANFPGPRFSLYSEVFPAARPESNWVAVVKAEEDVSSLHGHSLPFQFPGSYPRSYEEERAFPFTSNRIMETSVCQPLLPIITTSQGSSDDRMFHGGLAQVLDSELALSLLSSPTCSLGINDSHMVPAGRIPLAQPLFSTFHQHGLAHYTHSQDSNQISSTGFSYPGMVDEQVGGLLVSDAGDADLHF